MEKEEVPRVAASSFSNKHQRLARRSSVGLATLGKKLFRVFIARRRVRAIVRSNQLIEMSIKWIAETLARSIASILWWSPHPMLKREPGTFNFWRVDHKDLRNKYYVR